MDTFQWTLGARIADRTISIPNSPGHEAYASNGHESDEMISLNYSLPPYGGPYYCITAPVERPQDNYEWPNAVSEDTPTIIAEMWYTNIPNLIQLEGIKSRICTIMKETLFPDNDNIWWV